MALSGKLEADFSAFYEACAKAVSSLESLGKAGDDAAKNLKETDKEVGGLVGSLGELAAGVASGELLKEAFEKVVDVVKEAAMAFPELIAHTVEVGNSLYEMSLRTGASVENLSKLRYVASQTGIDFQSMGGYMQKMEQNLGASGQAADNLQTKLSALHLNLQTLKDEKPDQAFIDIMEGLHEIPSRADQAAIGVALFGKGFKEMAGLTQESITELMGEAEKLGLVMSTETAAAAHAAEVGFKSLQMQLESVGAHLASAFLPALVGLEQNISSVFKQAIDQANQSLDAMGGKGGFLSTVAAAMGEGDKAIAAQNQLYEYLKTAIITLVRDGVEPLITGVSMLMKVWDEALILGKLVMQGYNGITYAIEGLVYYYLKLSAFTDPFHASEFKANAATVKTAMDELYDKMAQGDADIEKLKQNQTDWGATATSTNAQIEKSLNALANTHTDAAATIKDFADKSKNAYGGIGTAVEGAKPHLEGLDKTLAELAEKIDTANNNNVSFAEKLKLWGPAAAKAAEEARALGKDVALSVQDLAEGFQQAEIDKAVAKWTSGLGDFEKVLRELPKVSMDSMKSMVAEYSAFQAAQEALYQQSHTGTELEIHDIERKRDAAIKALQAETSERDSLYDDTVKAINARYDHEIDVANKTASTIEERMAKQGVYTQEQLDKAADDAIADYYAMANSGQYTAAQLEAAAKKASDAWDKAAGDTSRTWAQTFSSMSRGAGELGSAFTTIGNAIGGEFGKIASVAGKALGDVKGGFDDIMKGLTSGDLLGEIAGITSGVIKLGAAAVSAFKSLFGLGTAGRDAVVAFADSMGGFDTLHAKLDALGADGEALWVKLTQGVGRNNPDQAKAVIQEVTDALNKQQDASNNTQQATEEQAAATIETATEASNALDTVTEKLKSNADDWQTWGDAVNKIINSVGASVLAMPTPAAPSAANVPGFETGTGGKYLNFGTGTLAMLHGNERVMTEGESAGEGTRQTINVVVGQDVIARAAVAGMPRQFTIQGL